MLERDLMQQETPLWPTCFRCWEECQQRVWQKTNPMRYHRTTRMLDSRRSKDLITCSPASFLSFQLSFISLLMSSLWYLSLSKMRNKGFMSFSFSINGFHTTIIGNSFSVVNSLLLLFREYFPRMGIIWPMFSLSMKNRVCSHTFTWNLEGK